MMSLAAIQRVSRDAAIRAARYKQVPLVFEFEDLIDFKARLKAGEKFQFRLPFLGDLVPRGWRYTDREPLFVDATGCGLESEPALTWRAFFESVCVGFGYAVVEAGQFQAYVREFERDDSAVGNENEFADLTSGEQAEFNEVIKQVASQFDEQKHVQNASGPDVAIRFEGSICLFEPKTARAREWIQRHVLDPQWFGRFLVVEPRYAKPIAAAMKADKLCIA